MRAGYARGAGRRRGAGDPAHTQLEQLADDGARMPRGAVAGRGRRDGAGGVASDHVGKDAGARDEDAVVGDAQEVHDITTAPVLKVRVLKVAFDAFNSSKLAPAAKVMLLLSLLLKSRTMSLFPNMVMRLLSLSLRNAVLPVPTTLTQLLWLSVNEWWPDPVCWTGLPVPALQGPPEVPAAWAVMGPAMA